MSAERPILLMTRPLQAGRDFVDTLPDDIRSAIEPVFAPLIQIEGTGINIDQGSARGLILTSSNAVEIARVLQFTTDLPCSCVGTRTTQAARNAGWAAQTGGDTADALVADLIARRPPAPLLHLCGRHRRGQIAERLTEAGLPTSECAIYDQRLLGAPPEVLARLNTGQTVIAPVFSPRTARQFVEEFATRGHIHAIALSDAVADPLLSCGFASVSTACRPDARAMVEELRRVLAETARLEAKGSAQ